MAGSMTQVDLAGLHQAIQQFATGLEGFNTSYKSMSATCTTIESAWTGAAQTTFVHAMEKWLTDFNKVISVLNGMDNALAQNTSVLTATNENTIARAQAAAAGITAPPLPGF
jgi:WXG100 family type VII secretion target